jgi:L-malate glycosyltransferase
VKLCLLANAASIHTRRWATHFSQGGHDVTVLSLSDGEIPGVTVKRVGPEPRSLGRIAYLLSVPRVRKVLRALRPDVVHAHYAGGYGLVGVLSGYHPLVVSAWGSDVLVVPRAGRLMKWIIRKCLSQADLVTSVAVHMSAAIRALGVSGEIVTLPFGADTTVFHPRDQDSAEVVAPPLIVSTRNLEPIYNVGLLIDAVPGILAGASSSKVAIIGDGTVREQLERRARELGVERNVTFTGRLMQPKIAEYLSKADIYVSTSLSDGNSISLSEGMACGAFPVVTDIPANREWIENGRNGYLVETEDPSDLAKRIIEALRAPELRRAAASLNWQLVQRKGSWKAAMAQMEKEYAALAQRCGQRSLECEVE